MITFFSFHFTYGELAILMLVALFTGMSKVGIQGAGMMSVPMLAAVFGGQLSSGILLPMLCLADIMGVWYYHRHASWKHLKILFPWAAVGVVIGTITGNYINDEAFRIMMATIIVVSVVVMVWLEKGHREDVPDYHWFGVLTGVAGGFTSMVGNLAGSVMAVYLLSMRLPKNIYIGTTAWFFLFVNLFKVPFHVFSWHTITGPSVLINLMLLPMIAVGAYLGIAIVSKISDKLYRWFIIIMTLIAAVFMILK